jgi:hypothetical protein
MSRERLEQMRDRITSQVFGHLWGHCLAGIAEVAPHLDAALMATWQVNGRLAQEMLPRDVEVPWLNRWRNSPPRKQKMAVLYERPLWSVAVALIHCPARSPRRRVSS